MLSIIFGTDTAKTHREAHKLLQARGSAAPIVIQDPETAMDTLRPLVEVQDLFGDVHTILLDEVFGDESFQPLFFEIIQKAISSPHLFVVRELHIDAPTLKKLEKEGVVGERYDRSLQSQKEHSPFALTDAFGARDRKNAWVEYMRARAGGMTPEEIIGMLFWQIKSMLLAAHASSPDEAGQKPFVFNKAKSFARNYPNNELPKLSATLISLYHEARRGGDEIETALEKFLLRL